MMSEYLTRLLSHVSDKEMVLTTEILDKVDHLYHMPTNISLKTINKLTSVMIKLNHEMYTTTVGLIPFKGNDLFGCIFMDMVVQFNLHNKKVEVRGYGV